MVGNPQVEISLLDKFQVARDSSETPCFGGGRIRSEAFAGQRRGFAGFNFALAE